MHDVDADDVVGTGRRRLDPGNLAARRKRHGGPTASGQSYDGSRGHGQGAQGKRRPPTC
jgi:hypothetical protein